MSEQPLPPDLTFEIASGALAEGAAVSGAFPLAERLPRHRAAVRWPEDGPIPPAMLGNATLRLVERRWAFPPGTMHALQELHCQRQPVSDEIEGTVRVSMVDLRRGRPWVRFAATFEDEEGTIGATTATFALPDRVELPDTETQPWRPPRPGNPEGGEAGPALRISQERISMYSEDSLNARIARSVHANPEIALAAGLPATLAQGLMGIDIVTAWLHQLGQPLWPATYRCAFTAPIYCGQSVVAHVSADLGWSRNDDGDLCTIVAVER